MPENDGKPHVGCHVIYTDPVGVDHDALVTAVWSPTCINVVIVSSDVNMDDNYGRQIARATSVSKAGAENVAYGRNFRMPGEPKPEYKPPQEK